MFTFFLPGCFTTDVIGSCAFGLDCNSFKEPNSPFRVYGKKIFEVPLTEVLRQGFAQGFPNTARALGIRQFRPDITDFFKKVVEDTVSYREKNSVTRNDFLQLLVEMKSKGTETTGMASKKYIQEVWLAMTEISLK